MSAERDPSGQALAVPATPASAVDGPSGFDPSREIDAMFVAYRALSEISPKGRDAAFDYLLSRFTAEVVAGKKAAMAVTRFARKLQRMPAQRIEAGTDETPKEVRTVGREPDGDADAPENKAVDPYALGGGKWQTQSTASSTPSIHGKNVSGKLP